jgi:hypothetical protein
MQVVSKLTGAFGFVLPLPLFRIDAPGKAQNTRHVNPCLFIQFSFYGTIKAKHHKTLLIKVLWFHLSAFQFIFMCHTLHL